MKNLNDMTLDECRDELAMNAGYKPTQNHWYHPKFGCCFFGESHPIPATLDSAAKLPEGWYVNVHHIPPDASDPTEFWSCDARTATVITPVKAYAPTELLARFRLRIAVEREERNKHDRT